MGCAFSVHRPKCKDGERIMAQEKMQTSLFYLEPEAGGSPVQGLGERQQPPLETPTDTGAKVQQSNKVEVFLKELAAFVEEQKKPAFIDIAGEQYKKERQRLAFIRKKMLEQSGNVVADRYLLKDIANFANRVYQSYRNTYLSFQKHKDEKNWASVDRSFFCNHAVKDYSSLSAGDGGHLYLGGVAHCDNLWICPQCSPRILSARAEEIAQLEEQAKNNGYELCMFTFTLPHSKRDALLELIQKLQSAYGYMHRMYAFKQIMELLGNHLQRDGKYVTWGRIKSIEIMLGKHGWHPHLHVVMIVEKGADVKSYSKKLSKLWLKSLQSVGVAKSSRAAEYVRKHGLTVTKNPDPRYIAKEMQPSIAKEMTAGFAKDGRDDDSINPFQLLVKIVKNLENPKLFNRYLRFWIEYVCATFQLKKLTWSPKLKGFFGIGEKSDEEIIEEQNKKKIACGLTTGVQAEIRKAHMWADFEKYINDEREKVMQILVNMGRQKEYDDADVVFHAADYFVTKYFSHVRGEVLTKAEVELLLALDDDKELSEDTLLDAYILLARVKSYRSYDEAYTLKRGYVAKRIGLSGSIIKRETNKISEMSRAWGRKEYYFGGLPKQLPTLEQLESNEELREVVYSIFDERDIARAWCYRQQYEEEQVQQAQAAMAGGSWPRINLDDCLDVPF